MPVWEQFQSFFFTVAIGFTMGFIIDGYRSIHRLWRPTPLMTMLGDLTLWVSLSGLVFFLLLLNTWGEVRAYVIIGMLVGILIYRQWCSSFVVFFWEKLLLTVDKLIRLLIKITTSFFRLIKRIIGLPLLWGFRIGRGIGRKVKGTVRTIKGRRKK